MKFNTIAVDMKRLAREPILMLLMFVPVIALVALKLVAVYGTPLLMNLAGFDLKPYFGYITVMALLIAPCMLSTVAAFMMIDDRDENMTDLMAVTPMGYSGYILNRLLMPFLFSFAYTFLGYYLLNIYSISITMLCYLAFLVGIESIILGLLLFSLTDNKVKGLTYAKAMDGFILTALADLLSIKWLSVISACLPFYWISSLVIKPFDSMNLILAFMVHLAWLGIAVARVNKA